jgi:hypothetical protein
MNMRWLCNSCGCVCDDDELLSTPSPFDAETMIFGCPNCKAAEDFTNACDDPGCPREACCGFQTQGGYRRTCSLHATYSTT